MSNKANDELRQHVHDTADVLFVISAFVDNRMVYSEKFETIFEAEKGLQQSQIAAYAELNQIADGYGL